MSISNTKVYIRTDANEEIATGHMMRCMTVATALVEMGADVEFVVSDEKSTALLINSKFNYVVLNTDWKNLDSEDEINKINKIVEAEKNKELAIIVDSYFVNNRYFKQINKRVKKIYFDDLFASKYDVDLLINYSLYFPEYDYDGLYIKSNTKLLLGTKYVPLREQFKNVENSKIDDSKHILLICGGGDPLNILSSILKFGIENTYINKYKIYDVVAGAYNPNIGELKQIASENSNINIHENVKDMASLMTKAEIIVSAASTVLYEACALGVPTIFYCMADNQENDGLYFVKETNMIYAGDIRKKKEACIRLIYKSIEYLDSNPLARKIIKQKMNTLFDCNGARRIAEEILKI